jgi:3-methyl-2-oxobutanoate hydroxymethyltransferase
MSSEKMVKKVTIPDIAERKKKNEKIAALTAYDYLMAQILDEAGMDIILVGDSLGMVFAGYSTTIPITMNEMIYHAKIVNRVVQKSLVIVDMPFMSYQVSVEEALRNAGRFLKEAEVQGVKLEGGENVAEIVAKLVSFGIPVMGHIGLVPQSINRFGGYKLQGKDPEIAMQLKRDAKILEEAGAFSIVLEKIPATLAAEITTSISIPTIGIGAGPHCDGQILVSQDLLGMFEKFRPRFVRRYAELGTQMRSAFKSYIDDVKAGSFPGRDEYFE